MNRSVFFRLIAGGFLWLVVLAACARPAATGTAPPSVPPAASEAAATSPTPAQPTTLPPATTSPVETHPAATTTPTPPLEATPTGPAETPGTGEAPVIEPLNAESLEIVQELTPGSANSFSWIAGGEQVALTSEDQVQLFSLEQAETMGEAAAQMPNLLVSSPDQARLAWSGLDNQVHIWNAAAGEQAQALEGNGTAVTGLAFSPKGDILAVARDDNRLVLWDLASDAEEQSWDQPYFLSDLAFSPDGSQLAGVDPMTFTIHIFDRQTGEEVSSLSWEEHASPVLYGVKFSPDWSQVAWVARGTVQLMDVETGQMGPDLGHEDFVNAVDWSPDGRLIASSAAGTVNGIFSPLVILWDASTGEGLNVLPSQEPVLDIGFSPDGTQLAVLTSEGNLQVWSALR